MKNVMLTHHTHDPMMSLLVDRSRRACVDGPSLAAIHRSIGTLLAIDVARGLSLEGCEIEHPTGPAIGVRVMPERQPVIVALLRAGLFLAEGIWERLPGGTLVLHDPRQQALDVAEFGDRPAVIVDAVVNTGRSMTQVMDTVRRLGARNIMVVTLVGYRPTLEGMAAAMPEITFVAARLSERSYVGKGGTDTGARLFGSVG